MAKKNTTIETDDTKKMQRCFIITPIGAPGSEINLKAFGLIKAVMQPVLDKFNFEPIAASDISAAGSINKQILISLYEDDLVIANLTGLNANVMYEVAVRHAVRKPIVIMAEKGTDLPFDLKDQRCVFYDDTLHGVDDARATLEKFINSALKDENISNPIYDSIQEQQIIKVLSEDNNDPLKFILNKLERMEDIIGTKNNSSSNKSFRTYSNPNREDLPLTKIELEVINISLPEAYEKIANVLTSIGYNMKNISFRSTPTGFNLFVPAHTESAIRNLLDSEPYLLVLPF